jgi:prepilin-type N-terminal cleavage/methylation domain-containing protein
MYTHVNHGFNVLQRTKERGFSLVELMAVVGIIAIAAMLGAPNFVAWKQRYQLKQAVIELQTDLNLSRMVALSRNTTVTVTLAVVGGRVTATFTNPGATSADCLGTTSMCVLPTFIMHSDVTALVTGPTTVSYSALGLRVGGGPGNQVVTLRNVRGDRMDIQVTPAGKSRWCTSSPCPVN